MKIQVHILAIVSSLNCFYSYAQVVEGIIIYEQTKLETEEIPSMANSQKLASMMGNQKTKKTMLLFNQTESLYKLYDNSFENKSEVKTADDGAMFITVHSSAREDVVYSNFSDKLQLKQRELMGKKFLVSSELTTTPWKLQQDRKEILGYKCVRATYEDDTDTITTWFTPQIPVATGPRHYGQLPGIILELEIKNKNVKFSATDVKEISVTEDMLKPPKKGKKVTTEEYETVSSEKQAEKEKYNKTGGWSITVGD